MGAIIGALGGLACIGLVVLMVGLARNSARGDQHEGRY
jgi:hypothetical protein